MYPYFEVVAAYGTNTLIVIFLFFRRGLPVGVLSGPGFCKKYPKTQQFKPFDWNSNKNKFASQFDTMDVTSSKHVSTSTVFSCIIHHMLYLT